MYPVSSFLYVVILVLVVVPQTSIFAFAFAPVGLCAERVSSVSVSSFSFELNLFTRWGSSSTNSNNNSKDPDSGVEQVMNSMQSFKTNQKIGSMTSSLLQELTATTVEGRSEDGNVVVKMNGQQYPLSCQIEDPSAPSTSLATAITQAMQDAHAKSVGVMESKMKSVYDDLGLPLSPNKSK